MNTKLPYTRMQKISEVASGVLLFGLVFFLISNWSTIPDQVPTHFNGAGVADKWGGKGSLIALPVVSFLMYAMLTVISFFPTAWNTPVRANEKNYTMVYQNTRSLLCNMKLAIVAMFSYITVTSAAGRPLGSLFTPAVLTLVLGTAIWYILKIVILNKKMKS